MPVIDARRHPGGPNEADVCIVGAGAAGITLAHEFIGSKLKVVLVESGDFTFRHRPQFLYMGENIGLPNYSIAKSRFRTFGGSTTRWGGQCRPFDRIDFEQRDWMPGSGWPFDRGHLDPFYARAPRVCNLLDYEYDPNYWRHIANGPLPIDVSALETRIYHFSRSRDFGVTYREPLSKAPNIDVWLNANAVEIETEGSGGRVTAIRARTFNGREIRFSAGAHVIACGGIENARLMLASNKVERGGVGNRNDLVGRFFADHPYFVPGYFEPAEPRYDRNFHIIEDYDRLAEDQGVHAAFGLTERQLREEQLNGAAIYFIRRPDYKVRAEYFSDGGRSFNQLADVLRHSDLPDGHSFQHIRTALSGFRDVAKTLGRQIAHAVKPVSRLSVRTVIETSPHRDSRVTLGPKKDRLGLPRVQVDWRINADDQRGLERLLDVMRVELPRSGSGHLVEDLSRLDNGWPNSMVGGKHHIGTTRIHTDAKQGVVDEHCRVHGVSNLYMAGSSVFPTASYANPTLTIVALAVRLADRLKALPPNGGRLA